MPTYEKALRASDPIAVLISAGIGIVGVLEESGVLAVPLSTGALMALGGFVFMGAAAIRTYYEGKRRKALPEPPK